jgi:hypothetical protein
VISECRVLRCSAKWTTSLVLPPSRFEGRYRAWKLREEPKSGNRGQNSSTRPRSRMTRASSCRLKDPLSIGLEREPTDLGIDRSCPVSIVVMGAVDRRR